MNGIVARSKSNGSKVKSALRVLQFAALITAVFFAAPAFAATDIQWWHAMSGELGKQLEKLAADFNASQSDYRIVPTYKGNYTETVTAAIFAFRSRSQPAIVHSGSPMPGMAIKSWPAAEVRPDTSGEVGSAACSAVADTAIVAAATNPRMEIRGNTSHPTA